VREETGEITGTADKDYNIIWFTETCLSNALRLEQFAVDAELSGRAGPAGDGRKRGVERARRRAGQGQYRVGAAVGPEPYVG
jgi:hypothetical protein